MKKSLVFILLFSFAAWAKSSAIFVNIKNSTVKVSIPNSITQTISLNVENSTSNDYFMKLENKDKVIKLFTLRANKIYSLDFKSTLDGLKLVPLAPPFKTIPLDKANQNYEISKI